MTFRSQYDVDHMVFRAMQNAEDYSHIHKFGFNDAIVGAEETVWDEGGIYAFIAAATVLKIASTSVDDDNDAGTGAWKITVYGLDGNYAEISESVNLDGQSAVLTTQSFLRIHRMIVTEAGDGETNAGIIRVGTGDVTAGVPDNVFGRISAGEGQTLMAVYTIPANKRAWMMGYTVSMGQGASGSDYKAQMRLKVRPNDEVFQVKEIFPLGIQAISVRYSIPQAVQTKSDIMITSKRISGAQSMSTSATFDILLIDL